MVTGALGEGLYLTNTGKAPVTNLLVGENFNTTFGILARGYFWFSVSTFVQRQPTAQVLQILFCDKMLYMGLVDS